MRAARRSYGPLKRARMLWVLMLGLALTLLLGSPALANQWKDISDQQWSRDYQLSASEVASIAEGYPDGTFRPWTLVSRQQFAKMVVTGLAIDQTKPSKATFTDVPTDSFYFMWVESAAHSGIVTGYADHTFRGKDSIIRQQANTMLARYLSQKEIAETGAIKGEKAKYSSLEEWYSAEGKRILESFADANKVATVHAPFTAYLVARGVTKGVDRDAARYLMPNNNLTRAQAVAMIFRVSKVDFKAAPAARLVLSGIPNPVEAGSAFSLTVKVLDEYGNQCTDYRGEVHFTSTDAQAVLPDEYTFTAADAGVHTFTGVVFKTTGSQTITVADKAGGVINGSQTVTVTSAAGSVTKKIVIEDKADGTGQPINAKQIASGASFTAYAISRDATGNFVDNVAADWSLINKTGSVANGDLVAAADGKSAVFTGHAAGTGVIHAVVGALTDDTGIIIVIAGSVTKKIVIEDKADGTGQPINAKQIASGTSFTAYAISRDAAGNFVANVAATWSLINKTGGVVDGDLVPSADKKSAVFTGHAAGTGVIRAVFGALTDDTGIITVTNAVATKIVIEDKADGTGQPINAKQIASGTSFTAYAISRDATGNFVDNVAADWSLINKTGSVANGDLVAAADGKSAVFTGHAAGTGVIRAVFGALTDDTGIITVTSVVAPPAVTSVAPSRGPTLGGNVVTINGTNLGSATQVTFGGTPATIKTNTATVITVTAPAHSAGVVDVQVVTAGGTSSNTAADDYTFALWEINGKVEGQTKDGKVILSNATVKVVINALDPLYDAVTLANNLVGTATSDANGDYAISTASFREEPLPVGTTVDVTALCSGYKSVTQYGSYDRPTVVCSFQSFTTGYDKNYGNRRLPLEDGMPPNPPWQYLLPNYLTVP